ncbi:Adenylate and Guanylate cyclase catalytic domain-containing protein [Brevibacterium sp. 239c]|uniref:adenylate/guanylate cyclase domain-containing protein n=1 Tax=Brevibacterium sp. 239c TaxID=1965356 RepID=UPI000C6BB899|nr:adenylate/guanylate cyclase domain-containing protein [Brevibacterium sp. 239c]SMX68234.1 Adenylate and Guanylate cyclase catalytic domain-containing protein [Brevibacterium sp. 239c]
MTGVSDFTAEFNTIPERDSDGTDDISSNGMDSDDAASGGTGSAGTSAAGTNSTGTNTAEAAADESTEVEDSADPEDSYHGLNSIPVITEEQIDSSPDSAGSPGSAAAHASPAASAPPSVPGIEHGDEDLLDTSVMSTIPRAEDGASDDEESSGSEPVDEHGGDFFEGLHEDPRTAALQIVDEADEDEDDTVYETRSAAERLEEILLDGKRVLDRREAAKLGGISTVSARKMWRALGMSQTDGSEKAYTVSDAHALRMWAKPVADGLIDQGTALSLARAIGQTTDRLVVWQMETLVDFLTEEKGLTDPEARRDALQVVEDMVDPLQKMLTYSWRRNLAEVMGRLNVNVSDGLAMDNRQGWYDSSMPLARAVGFIDLVSYTRLSQKMEPRQLANLVQEFQGMAYNIVATGGGRVIKTVGDEVFFAAETPMSGAEIAMTLMERVTAAEDLPQARVGFVWGRVLSRLGDIFGSSVNLAARLTAVADPGTIFTDEDTARVLSASDAYVFERRESLSLQGLGETGIGEMKRGTAARMQLDLDDDES